MAHTVTPSSDFPGSRQTVPGHVPSSWQRPRRPDVLWLALTTAVYGGFLSLSAPEHAIDFHLIYTSETLHDRIREYGPQGRAFHQLWSIADLGFIVLYGALLRTWFRFLSVRHVLPGAISPRWASLTPLCDLVETVSAVVILSTWPDTDTAWISAAVVATPLKWITLGGVSIWIALGEIRLYRQRPGRRRR